MSKYGGGKHDTESEIEMGELVFTRIYRASRIIERIINISVQKAVGRAFTVEELFTLAYTVTHYIKAGVLYRFAI